MKKICFIIHEAYSIGGEQTVLARLVNSLCERYDITIYTHENKENKCNNEYKFDSRITVKFVKRLDNNLISKIHRTVYRYYRYYINNNYTKAIHKARLYPQKQLKYWIDEINGNKYESVIAVSGSRSYSRLLAYIKDNISAKTIAWEHNSYEAYFKVPQCYYYKEEDEFSNCWKRIDQMVFLNDDMKKKVKENLSVEGLVISNPCPFSSEIKSECSEPNIVSVGRLEREKGFDDVIKAFANIHDDYPEWRLTIVGDGSLRQELEHFVHEKALDHCVNFLGYQQNVRSELLKASVFVMGSKWEGMPMTILEAIECGLPIVGYDIPALVSMLNSGTDSFLVSVNNIKMLETSMRKIMSDDVLRKKMGESASITAKKYSIEEVTAEWEKIL
ncbi:glycosyltransferase [Butyrivibrio fibrisolvens]|uniref:glycosyltransferase n=1 Tax=Butyrivibrio fibrisolvens TaxID=831 RepID=UPI0003F635E3|nr:glycosyltransferase [Butyrivibrio fibrisolvens]